MGVIVPFLTWGSRRYRRKIFGKLQLICNQYFAKQILWVLEPCLRRRDLGWPKTP
jgi:hypothetical protein